MFDLKRLYCWQSDVLDNAIVSLATTKPQMKNKQIFTLYSQVNRFYFYFYFNFLNFANFAYKNLISISYWKNFLNHEKMSGCFWSTVGGASICTGPVGSTGCSH